VDLEKIDNATAVLSIGFFSEQTPSMVEEKLKEISNQGIKKLIVDLRGNDGGGFDQAVKVASLFLPENTIVAGTKNREGHVEKFHSSKEILPSDVQIVLLTNKKTFCGAELLTAALKENKKVKIVGETTFGKWTAQNLETLPNQFAIKYTTLKFLSPLGNTFQDVGIKPDLEVKADQDFDQSEVSSYDMPKRLAFELIKAM
jgi:carboxyl-terminal processing protease